MDCQRFHVASVNCLGQQISSIKGTTPIMPEGPVFASVLRPRSGSSIITALTGWKMSMFPEWRTLAIRMKRSC
jgi:hypothetical protein